jgi:tight adherence protein C
MFDQPMFAWTITLLVFGSVALLAFAGANVVLQGGKRRQRFSAVGAASTAAPASNGKKALSPERLGLDAGEQRKLRQDLIKAGFFSPGAVKTFATARLASVILLPLVSYLLLAPKLSQFGAMPQFALLSVMFLLGYFMPRAYIDRRKDTMLEKYRLAFPDFLDLLVVCVDAGLSLEAALERVTAELGDREPELQANLAIMAGETRAGRGTIDALHGFAERLGLDEARSLVVLLQQSLELGTDISQALTTYSEEMREKRMSRAEQKAYALPVKLVLPLGAFIFPVILIVIMTPVIIRLMTLMSVK